MAKAKASKPIRRNPHRALQCRVSFLYQAAMYFATRQQLDFSSSAQPAESKPNTSNLQPVARHLVNDLRTVSLKGQILLAPAVKHTICKNCDTLLVGERTCSYQVENKSKGGKKPWADVLLRTCRTCGQQKRFPQAAQRQLGRLHRQKEETARDGPTRGQP